MSMSREAPLGQGLSAVVRDCVSAPAVDISRANAKGHVRRMELDKSLRKMKPLRQIRIQSHEIAYRR